MIVSQSESIGENIKLFCGECTYLVDGELAEERGKAVHLLRLLQIRVKLRNTLESKLLHEVDHFALVTEPLLLELLHLGRVRSGE